MISFPKNSLFTPPTPAPAPKEAKGFSVEQLFNHYQFNNVDALIHADQATDGNPSIKPARFYLRQLVFERNHQAACDYLATTETDNQRKKKYRNISQDIEKNKNLEIKSDSKSSRQALLFHDDLTVRLFKFYEENNAIELIHMDHEDDDNDFVKKQRQPIYFYLHQLAFQKNNFLACSHLAFAAIKEQKFHLALSYHEQLLVIMIKRQTKPMADDEYRRYQNISQTLSKHMFSSCLIAAKNAFRNKQWNDTFIYYNHLVKIQHHHSVNTDMTEACKQAVKELQITHQCISPQLKEGVGALIQKFALLYEEFQPGATTFRMRRQ